METTIKKWGNSLAMRLPRHIVKKFALRDGSRVAIEERRGEIIITPLKSRTGR